MGLRDLARVLIRLYGLLLLFYCLQTGQQVFIYKTMSATFEQTLRVGLASSAASGILYGIMGVCLLVFSKTISGWVAPETSNGLNIVVSTPDLALVSFSLVGLYFFVDGISWLVHDGVVWRLTTTPLGPKVPLDARATANLGMAAIKVVVGLFLLFGSRGVLRVVRWVRADGGSARDAAKLPGILKCPNCGAEYDPEDYSQDALDWFCPRCEKKLPRE
jgi:hypothetical protein